MDTAQAAIKGLAIKELAEKRILAFLLSGLFSRLRLLTSIRAFSV
jgi:hypothetical protein